MTRLLAIMGSGETAPTMAKVHRGLLARLGNGPVPAVFLDTPFGFQVNAGELTDKCQEYFRQSVGQEIGLASFRSKAVADDALAYEQALNTIRSAAYLFAGPGSPTYTLRTWDGTRVPDEIAAKVRPGGSGCVTFASAAALTLGVATVPVYEIYKVGEEARWLPGLDLLGQATGLSAAVIPHYDNAEGGHHDTRFCYLGEHRLSAIEPDLPDGAFVLGVDEHTALVIDLDTGAASVQGKGGVTVRHAGESVVFPAGSSLSVDEIRAAASGQGVAASAAPPPSAPAVVPDPVAVSLRDEVDSASAAFDVAFAAKDVDAAVRCILDLDDAVVAWSADTLQSDDRDRARAAIRSMVVRLGDLARVGAADPRDVVGPYVEAILELRTEARADKRYADADAARDKLIAIGVEVRDSPQGTEWVLP